MSPSNQPIVSAYIPTLIRKSRRLTPEEMPVIDRPDASIKINMNTLEKVSTEQIQNEAEAFLKIAEFSPLATPAPGYVNEKLFDPRDLVRPEQELQETMRFSSVGYQKRSHLWVFIILMVILLSTWVASVSWRVGLDVFRTDPIKATKTAFSGQVTPLKLAKKKAHLAQGPIIEEDTGERLASVGSLAVYKRYWVVKGDVINGTRKVLSGIILELELNIASDPPRRETHKQTCCGALSSGLTPEEESAQLNAFIKEKRGGGMLSHEVSDRISPEGKAPFTWVVPIPKGVSKTITPQVAVKITFYD
jgi:hypothetical protein